jgi:hypothetical protein
VCLALAVAGCGSSSSSSSSASTSSATSSTTSAGASGAGAQQSPYAGQLGFEGVPIQFGPILAPASTTQTGTVDGISCQGQEQLVYHIHAHLLVYVNGAPRALPGGIGIPGSTVVESSQGPVATGGECIYWLHTHAPDGVIHIESPTQRIYTLGEFFDVWHQPLSAHNVAGSTGAVTAFVNGKRSTGSPRSIKLLPHTAVQLDVGEPKPAFQPVSWAGTNL